MKKQIIYVLLGGVAMATNACNFFQSKPVEPPLTPVTDGVFAFYSPKTQTRHASRLV